MDARPRGQAWEEEVGGMEVGHRQPGIICIRAASTTVDVYLALRLRR